MLVKCEKCEAAFNLKDSLIKEEGAAVRCSKCKHVFKVYPPSAQFEEGQVKPIESEPIDRTVAIPDRGQQLAIMKAMQERAESVSEGDASDRTVTLVDFSEEAFNVWDNAAKPYIELGSIGEGGMGEVRVAKDTMLLRKVAIKSLKEDIASSAAIRYFLREAQITAQLDHPNIVPLYTVKPPENESKNVSFVMKLIKGRTLGDIITKARAMYQDNPKAVLPQELDLNSRLGYFLKACEGVIYAHRKEVIHRDLKPSNIMIGDFGEVYIMDWGIAKMLKDVPETLMGIEQAVSESRNKTMFMDITESGGIVGTPSYMSPEQAKGLPEVERPSDIFSLGVILFELATLKPPRPGDPNKKMKWAREGYLNQVSPISPEHKIPPELVAIINKATEFEPKNRYPSVSSLAEDVRSFLRGDEVTVMPDTRVRKVWRYMNRHRELTLIALLTLFLILASGIIFSQFQRQSAMEAARQREIRLTRLLSDVSKHAHVIDSRFLHLEDLIAGFANSAMYLIQDAPPNNEKLFWLEDFKDPTKAPPDHKHSQLYRREVSIDYPVVKPSPGVKPEDVKDLMQKLAPLRFHFKKLLLDSRNSLEPLSEEEARRLLTVHGLSISWAYIGLEVGVMYSYPGKGSYPDEYDPRLRPWYTLGAHKNAVYWGNPYVDLQGLGMVLPAATSLYDRNGKFYGVVGMDVTYNHIIHENLMRKDAVGVVESSLLDENGRVVIKSSQLSMSGDEFAKDPSLKLAPFSVPEVVQAIHKRESGLVEVMAEGKPRIVVFQQMRSLGWYYVEELDSTEILTNN